MFIVLYITATRSAAGLMEWENPSQALEALAACNHYVIRDAGTVNSLPGSCHDQSLYVAGAFLENCYIHSKTVIICSKSLLLHNVRDFENVWNLQAGVCLCFCELL